MATTTITINAIFANGLITNAFAQEVGDWRTYISPEYKFSIEYPAGLDVEYGYSKFSNSDLISFINFQSDLDSYHISIRSNDMSLLEYIDKFSPLYEGEEIQTLEKPAPIAIAGKSGYSSSHISGGGLILHKQVVFVYGDYIFKFDVTTSPNGFVSLISARRPKLISVLSMCCYLLSKME